MRWIVLTLVWAICGCASNAQERNSESGLQVGVFRCDATPPAGHPLRGPGTRPLEVVDDPLLAKGVILFDGSTRYVLCALDWCALRGSAYDLFRKKIAAAAETRESHVAVQCLHQHNAPIADIDAQLLLDRHPPVIRYQDLQFLEEVTDRIAAVVRDARKRMRTFTHVGFGSAKVEKFASNRRVLMPDGTLRVRYSSTKDPVLKGAPEGKSDPWLRTVTLFDGDQPLVRLHYYATHPQSYYNDGRATSEPPGLARVRLEKEEGVPQIYFTGCQGDVAAGKYNEGTPEDRVRLTERLYAGMKGAIAATRSVPVTAIDWRTTEVVFPLRSELEWAEERFRRDLADPQSKNRVMAAWVLSWYERVKQRPGVALSRLRLGPVWILHLPSEPFIEYQLYAQGLRSAEFVAVAALGECGMGYICTEDAFAQGGYEPTMSLSGPPVEAELKKGIAGLLR